MGILDVLSECLRDTTVNFSTLMKERSPGAPPCKVGVDLSVYAHQGIRAADIKEMYALDFVAKPCIFLGK